MCLGSLEGKDSYAKELTTVINTFPNAEEAVKAKEILRFLKGDTGVFEGMSLQEAEKLFKKDPESRHYIAVVVYNTPEDSLTNIKVSISNYNKQNFKKERLNLGDATLSIEDKAQIILIKRFDNMDAAMAYYEKVVVDRNEYISYQNVAVDIFPISNANYNIMLSQMNARGYKVFFESNYLLNK